MLWGFQFRKGGAAVLAASGAGQRFQSYLVPNLLVPSGASKISSL